MNRLALTVYALLLTMATQLALSEEIASDLRRAVPADVYLVAYGQHNPERDYQRAHLAGVLKKVSEMRLIERVVESVTSRQADVDRERALALLDEFKTAVAPIDLPALLDSKEVAYAQRMEPFQIVKKDGDKGTLFTSQHLILLRLTPAVAGEYHRGITNLFQIIEASSAGKAAIDTEQHGSLTLTTLSLPDGAPYCPAIAHDGDVILFSSSCQFARDSLAMLLGNNTPSKFDDPRLTEALKQLPPPEDAVVFFDGRRQFDQIRQLVDTLHQQTGDHPEAERWFHLIETVIDEVAILDYLATVEYTDGNRNCEETLGQLLPNSEHRLLTEMLSSGQPFVDWQSWVPADATGYALSTGADLHPLYQSVVQIIQEQLPEMQLPLKNFENCQRQIDLHLDVDLLQAFSGECVAVTLPADERSWLGKNDVVWALRCHKPARIGWLLDRLVDQLNTYPLIKAQQLQLVASADLEGFQEVSATLCALFDIHPVVGFEGGWMFVGSSAEAVQKVLNTRAGQSKSITATPGYQDFQLEFAGTVRSVRFINMAQQTRQVAKVLQQAGAVLPIVIGLAEAQAEPDQEMGQLVPLRFMAELLPSLGEIIGEFDFLETQLKVIQDGDQPGTWREHKVTLVRSAAADAVESSN